MLWGEPQPSLIVWWKIAAVWCRWPQKGAEMVPLLVGGGCIQLEDVPTINVLAEGVRDGERQICCSVVKGERTQTVGSKW